jgi:transposase InsO family protein
LALSPQGQYWHVDTTFYPLIDGKEVCIAFVMDNYSKMILGFHVTHQRSWFVVKRALKQALVVAMQHPDQKESVLVTDGGTENHNKRVDAFIEKLSGYRIKKVRALKDIRFSNSPVEAVHRTMKGRYLKNRKFESVKALFNFLQWAVKDYNELRPHYKHRPKTPAEVYFHKSLGFDHKLRVKRALRQRLQVNKGVKCIQCQGIHFKKACNELLGKC